MPDEPLHLPRETALVVMGCQRGVLDLSGRFGALGRRAGEKGMVPAIAKILAACRETGRPVVYEEMQIRFTLRNLARLATSEDVLTALRI